MLNQCNELVDNWFNCIYSVQLSNWFEPVYTTAMNFPSPALPLPTLYIAHYFYRLKLLMPSMASMVDGRSEWRSEVIIFLVSENKRSGSADIAGIVSISNAIWCKLG